MEGGREVQFVGSFVCGVDAEWEWEGAEGSGMQVEEWG
jgi:hypothetical protein